MKIIIRKKYELTESTAQNTDSKSLTQQQFQAECDVNTIMAKYRKTNMITHLNNRQGNYGDFTNAQGIKTHLTVFKKLKKLLKAFQQRYVSDSITTPLDLSIFYQNQKTTKKPSNLVFV